MLIIIDIHKSFGESHVLKGINISLERGGIYTLMGGNGAGKTTLFNIITGFVKPDNGKILFKGEELTTKNPVAVNHHGVTRTFQDLRLATDLTVKENILLAFKNNPGEQIIKSILPKNIFKKYYDDLSAAAREIIEKIHLEQVIDNLAGEISYGQQKLLTLGVCIANDAELMLLDEPVAGIDKVNFEYIIELLSELKQNGKTILQIEHNPDYIDELSDRIWFLQNGRVTEFDSYNSYIRHKTSKENIL